MLEFQLRNNDLMSAETALNFIQVQLKQALEVIDVAAKNFRRKHTAQTELEKIETNVLLNTCN